MIIVFVILFFLISLFMYLVIVGANLSKSDYEKELENQEQKKYIDDYVKGLEDKKRNGKRKNFYRQRK